MELIVATALLAVSLVPALRLLRDAFEQSRRIETLAMMATLCVSKMEEHLQRTEATWQIGTAGGDFSADGRADLRYRAISSEDAAEGGIPERLMAITVTVWHDLDSDLSPDAGEPSVVLASKVAKMKRYQDEAGS
jgi:hypothetical protein